MRIITCCLAALVFLPGCVGSPLMEAAGRGNLAEVKRLSAQGAGQENRRGTSSFSRTPLEMAAQKGHVEVVRYFLAQGVDPVVRDEALADAAWGGHLECVKLLVEDGARVNRMISGRGMTILESAAGGGDPKTINYLLDQGAEVNARGSYRGYTALMFAAVYDQGEAIRVLLARGADPHIKSNDGKTALAIARSMGKQTAIRAFKESARLGISYRDVWGHVGRHMAAFPVVKCPSGDWHAGRVVLEGGGPLPEGLKMEGGVIEGTPTQPGRWLLRLGFKEVSCGGQRYADELVRVPINILGYVRREGSEGTIRALKELPIRYQGTQGHVGRYMAATPVAKCPRGDWRAGRVVLLQKGPLPEGLKLEDGVIKGTPTKPGSWSRWIVFNKVTCDGQRYSDTWVYVTLIIK